MAGFVHWWSSPRERIAVRLPVTKPPGVLAGGARFEPPRACGAEDDEVVTSSLTLLEVLVVAYRAGNLALAARYEAYLSQSRGVRMVEIGRPQLRMAAQLRALHPSIRTPDALQVAAALSAGCSGFVTNDRDLPTVSGLEVLRLRSYL